MPTFDLRQTIFGELRRHRNERLLTIFRQPHNAQFVGCLAAATLHVRLAIVLIPARSGAASAQCPASRTTHRTCGSAAACATGHVVPLQETEKWLDYKLRYVPFPVVALAVEQNMRCPDLHPLRSLRSRRPRCLRDHHPDQCTPARRSYSSTWGFLRSCPANTMFIMDRSKLLSAFRVALRCLRETSGVACAVRLSVVHVALSSRTCISPVPIR